MALAHRFAQAVHHEPCRFVRNAKHAVDLMRGHALLAGNHKKECRKPLRQRDFGTLKDGADRNRELFAACAALINAGAMLLSLKKSRVAYDATMWTDAASRPDATLKPLASLCFVSENLVLKDGGHGHYR